MHTQLEHILQGLRDHVDEHMKTHVLPSSSLPGRYEHICERINAAEEALEAHNYDEVLEQIGEINLDMIETIESMDDMIAGLVERLVALQHRDDKELVSASLRNEISALYEGLA